MTKKGKKVSISAGPRRPLPADDGKEMCPRCLTFVSDHFEVIAHISGKKGKDPCQETKWLNEFEPKQWVTAPNNSAKAKVMNRVVAKVVARDKGKSQLLDKGKGLAIDEEKFSVSEKPMFGTWKLANLVEEAGPSTITVADYCHDTLFKNYKTPLENGFSVWNKNSAATVDSGYPSLLAVYRDPKSSKCFGVAGSGNKKSYASVLQNTDKSNSGILQISEESELGKKLTFAAVLKTNAESQAVVPRANVQCARGRGPPWALARGRGVWALARGRGRAHARGRGLPWAFTRGTRGRGRAHERGRGPARGRARGRRSYLGAFQAGLES